MKTYRVCFVTNAGVVHYSFMSPGSSITIEKHYQKPEDLMKNNCIGSKD